MMKKPKAPWFKKKCKKIMGNAQDIRLLETAMNHLYLCEILLSISFSFNCFYEAKNISSLFISKKLISSLKKLNGNKFGF
jgi:hypothetical protein